MEQDNLQLGSSTQGNNELNNESKKKKEKKKGSIKSFIWGFMTCFILFCLLITVGVAIVYNLTTVAEREEALIVAGFGESDVVDASFVKKAEKIAAMIEKVYYKDDYDKLQLQDGMYKGMVDSLGDIYSTYYTKEEMAETTQDIEGTYGGIGAYISYNNEYKMCQISGTIEGSPSEKVGLLADDFIYKLDDNDVTTWTASEIAEYCRDEVGTSFVMTIYRPSKNTTMEFELTRDVIESVSAKGEMLEDKIGYIAISSFDVVTPGQYKKAFAELKDQGMKGLILDLRGNGGGDVDACIGIAQQILPKGLIVYTEDKNGNRKEYNCDGANEIDIPLVVLVNGYSASASEILSGAIQDTEKGILLGTKTYGKGIVQSLMGLGDGSGLKLTVYAYYTPKGRYIHGTGLEPDEVLEFDGDRYYDGDGVDNQLERAKEIINSKAAK